MAEYILSAFADEYSKNFDEQLIGLEKNGISYMEIRGVDGKSIADITEGEAAEIKKKLDSAGVGLSALGSPLGKYPLHEDIKPQLEQAKHLCETAHILGTDRIRMFSFYTKGENADDCHGEVMDKLGQLLYIAQGEGIVLCHENEKDIYGDSPLRCAEIQRYFRGEIKCVFDSANFINCGYTPYPDCYEMLEGDIFYFHIKDATAEHTIAPCGKGIGKIPEMLADYSSKHEGKVFLTLEPHLRIFAGLEAMQSQVGDGAVTNQYATSAEAFSAATEALKNSI